MGRAKPPSWYLESLGEPQPWHVTSFYRFTPLTTQRIPELRQSILDWMEEHYMFGLTLLAPEGVNATVAGSEGAVIGFKRFMIDLIGVDLRFKDSISKVRPFKRLTVDIRREIVGLKRPDLAPASDENSHLSPSEWHEWMISDRRKIVIDTRNRYETLAGKFKGAIDPQLKNFSDWGAYLDSTDIPSDVPVLMYCTGGIRCEKAIMEMQARGFEHVYQLRDGILGYMAEYPEGEFEGECYVFDDRVTVGPTLEPTGNFGNCPGCGLTASAQFECEFCGKRFFHCSDCDSKRPKVCSKTCLDRLKHKKLPI